MKRKLNVKLLLCLLAAVLVLGTATHFLHAYQLRRNAGILLERGKQFEDEGELGMAAACMARYLAYVPEDVNALAKYGELLEKFPQSSRARTQAAFVLEKVLRIDPKRDEVRRRLVRVEMSLGRYTDAADHIDRLLKGSGRDDGELEALRGRCREAAGEYARAAQTYQLAIDHAPERVQTYVDLGRLLRQRLDQAAGADAVMEALIKANPRSAPAYLARGRYRMTYALPSAADDINQARKLAPDDADVLVAAAAVLRQEKKSAESRQLLEHALERNPTDARLYLALARARMDADEPKEAVACLRRGLKAVPTDTVLVWALAEQLIQAQELFEAGELITRMGRAGFSPARLNYLQARIFMGKQQWGEAVRVLHSARPHLAPAPDLLKEVEFALGQCHEQQGDVEQQQAAYRRAIALDSRWLRPRLALAAALAGLGKDEEALTEYRQAAALPGAPPAVWVVLARLQMQVNLRLPPRQQDWKSFERDLDRAGRKLPESPEVPVLRAQALTVRGRTEQAQEVLEQARNRRPEQVELWAACVGLAHSRSQFSQAEQLLEEAKQQLGDTVGMRLLTIGYWASRPAAEALPILARQLEGLDQFSAADQDRLRRGLASAYHRLGRLDEARRQYEELVRRNPKDLPTRVQAFELAFEAGDEAAVPKMLAGIKQLEGPDGIWWRLGEAGLKVLQSRRGKPERLAEAKALLAEATARRPGWARVALLQGEIAELEKQPDRTLECYRRALDLGERRLPVVRRVVQLLYERNRFVEADQVLRRLQGSGELRGDLGRMAAELSVHAQNPTRALELAQQAVSPDSTDFKDHIWLGQVKVAAGKAKEAEVSFRRALELGKKEPAAWMALVQYLAQRKKPEEAEKLLREAKTKLPAEAAPLTLATGYEILGKPEEAEANYKAVLRERPNDAMALAQTARFYISVNRRAEAESHLRKLLDPKFQTDETVRAFARRGLSLCLADRGDFARFKEALALLEENGKKAVNPDEDRRALATILGTRPSRRREAIAILEDLSSRQKALAGDKFLLVRLYEADKEWPKARSRMLNLLVTDGTNPFFLGYYVRTLMKRGDFTEAAVWLEKLERLRPKAFDTVDLRARFYKAKGKTAQAVQLITSYAANDGADLARAAVLLEDLGEALAAEPLFRKYAAESKIPEANLTLALYLARMRKVTEALAICEKAWKTCRQERVAAVVVDVLQHGQASNEQAVEVEKKIKQVAEERTESPIFNLALGQLYYQRQRYAEAETRYRNALRQEGDNLIGLNNLAWLLTLRARKPDEALELVNKAIGKLGSAEDLYERPANSSVPNLLDTRAVTYLALGQVEPALKDLEPAVAATPTRTGFYHLALAHRMARNDKAAEQALREAAKLGFTPEQIDPLERKAVQQMIAP